MNLPVIKHITARVVCWILLLQLINISIDPPDMERATYASDSGEEDLSINDIESIYELVAEKVFDEDVPESDENDIDTASQTFDLYCITAQDGLQAFYDYFIDYEAQYLNHLSTDSPEPGFPPPKSA